MFEDQTVAFGENADGLFIKRAQEIPDEFLKDLRDERFRNSQRRASDMHRVASIPVSVVELWQREGFDVHKESAKAILARLRRDSLNDFITSGKV